MAGGRELSPAAGIGWGLLCASLGLAIALAAAGVLEAGDETFVAPRWVAAVCGIAFLLAGVILFRLGLAGADREGVEEGRAFGKAGESREAEKAFPVTRWLLAALVVSCLAAVSTWAAVSPGSGTLTLGAWGLVLRLSPEVETVLARVIATLAALLTLLAAVVVWLQGLARLRDGRRDG